MSTHLDGEQVVVEVADNGAGIPRGIIGRIFDPFFTTKAVGVGTGLGLAICHRIVTDIGGELTVESEVGKGTTFRVALPIARTKRSIAPPPVEPPAVAGRSGRVLVVDDDLAVLRVVTRILAPDHDVVALGTAEEALARLTGGEAFDLILCDLMMPGMTGMDLHQELARLAPQQASRLVFLTGGAFTTRARQFLADETIEHIEKPFEPAQLRAVVERHLR